MNTNRGEPSKKLDINNFETRYDPDMIQELLGESFNESYEFEGFEEEEVHNNPENRLTADKIKAVVKECKVENKQPSSIKNVEWKKVKIEIKKVTNGTGNIEIKNLANLNHLLKAARIEIAESQIEKSENNRKSKSKKNPM